MRVWGSVSRPSEEQSRSSPASSHRRGFDGGAPMARCRTCSVGIIARWTEMEPELKPGWYLSAL